MRGKNGEDNRTCTFLGVCYIWFPCIEESLVPETCMPHPSASPALCHLSRCWSVLVGSTSEKPWHVWEEAWATEHPVQSWPLCRAASNSAQDMKMKENSFWCETLLKSRHMQGILKIYEKMRIMRPNPICTLDLRAASCLPFRLWIPGASPAVP